MLYRIKNWEQKFETSETRKLKQLAWVPVPNNMDGAGYAALISHPNGAAHLGAWLAILEIASKRTERQERGTLPLFGRSTAKALAYRSRLPEALFEEVLERLCSEEIGWLEVVPAAGQSSGVPGENPGASGKVPKRIELNGMELNRTELTSASETVSVTEQAVPVSVPVHESETEQKSTSQPPPLVTEWPLTDRTIHELQPGTDEVMRNRIVAAARKEEPDIGDDALAAALRKTHKNGKQTSGALWTRTVPVFLRGQKKSGVLVPFARGKPIFANAAEEIAHLRTWIAEFPDHPATARSRERLDELLANSAPDKKPPGRQLPLCEAKGAMR